MFMMLQGITTESFPVTLRDIIELVTIVIAIAGIWYRLENKVNGYGKRTDQAQADASAAKTLADKCVIDDQVATAERAEIRERIAANETSVDNLHEELAQERLAVMSTLHANERAAAERDANLRVELAKLTERVDINRIVRSVVSEFKRDETRSQ
jgi:hypothetical protein